MRTTPDLPPPIASPEPALDISIPANADEIVCRIALWPQIWSVAVIVTLLFAVLPSVGIATSIYITRDAPASALGGLVWLLLGGPVVGLVCGVLLAVSQSQSPIQINRQGIHQEGRRLAQIEWAGITEVSLLHFLWIYGHVQIRHKNGPPFSIPLDMSRRPDFIAAVLRLAPEDNPLRKAVETAVSFPGTPE